MNWNFILNSAILIILIIVGLLIGLSIIPPVELQVSTITTQKDTLFEVSDTATVMATPDTATVQVAVVIEGEEINQVQSELNASNNNVIEAIRNVGIETEDIQTVQFNITPIYTYNPQTGEQSIDGYRATSRLEVRTTEFEEVNQVIDAATEAGANEIGQVMFVVDDRDEYIAQARQEAIEGAKQKAEDIAREAGINLGRLMDVQVFEGTPFPTPERFSADMAIGLGGGAETNVQPGQNEIQVTVQLFYALE